ncbi:hypothetical protein VNO77_20057 [Canavalia gladiata]|uniref:Uncharacterized protein n=1 Tax=Canavalia gladiata TaxID=3824 RepID=A0AAN9QQ66_CANGL
MELEVDNLGRSVRLGPPTLEPSACKGTLHTGPPGFHGLLLRTYSPMGQVDLRSSSYSGKRTNLLVVKKGRNFVRDVRRPDRMQAEKMAPQFQSR